MATTTGTTRRNGVSAAAPAAQEPREKTKDSTRAFNVTAAVVLTVFAVLWLLPSLFALKTSLTTNSTAALGAPAILSDLQITFGSYLTLFQAGDIWNWYLSSFITSAVTTVLTVLFASMGGYALSRLRFPGRNLVFLLMILGIMVPAQVLVVPTFQMLDAAGLLNTYWAVIFPQVPAVIALFVFKQFFDGLPRELEEAARIDGAGYWRIYRQVVMPLSGPVVAAMAIVTFVGVWNNLILPLFVLSNPELMTIPVGLATVQGSLPLVVLYMIFQRRIIEGVAGTGIKG